MANKKETKIVELEVIEETSNVLKGIVDHCELLNVRAEANLDSDVLFVLSKGDNIEVEKTKNKKWLKLINNKAEGFVCSDYVEC